MSNFVSTPETDADVLAIQAALKAIPIGGTITKAQLSETIGRPIDGCRHLLYRSIARLNKEDGAVFESVHGIGYKRLEIEAVPSVGDRARQTIRRKAKGALLKMAQAMAKANDVPAHVALKINQQRNVLSFISAVTKEHAAKTLGEDATAEAPTPIAKLAARLVEALR